MPTVMTHGVFAISMAHLFKHRKLPAHFWLLARLYEQYKIAKVG